MEETLGDLFGVAGIDRGACGGPAAPKAIRANCRRAEAWRALLRIRSRGEILHAGIALVFHHLEPVDDRAHRADHVVADPANNKSAARSREFEIELGHETCLR